MNKNQIIYKIISLLNPSESWACETTRWTELQRVAGSCEVMGHTSCFNFLIVKKEYMAFIRVYKNKTTILPSS